MVTVQRYRSKTRGKERESLDRFGERKRKNRRMNNEKVRDILDI